MQIPVPNSAQCHFLWPPMLPTESMVTSCMRPDYSCDRNRRAKISVWGSRVRRLRAFYNLGAHQFRHSTQSMAARKLFCRGGGGMAWAPGEGGGGVPEMGFRAGPFVLCKDGCCHQRRRNTNFGPENFFRGKIFPHICVVKVISAMWGSF